MTIAGSLLLYLSVFLLASFLIYIGNKKRLRFITILGLALPILLATLRFGVGSDYPSYIRHFENTDTTYDDFNDLNGNWTMEPTFWVFSTISRFLVGDSTIMFAIYSSITVIFFYLAVKRLKIPYLGLAMFLFFCFWFGASLSAIRQFAAISIFMFSLQYMIGGNFKKYLVTILVASLFHVTSLLLIPLFFLRKYVKRGEQFVKKNMSRTVFFALIAMAISVIILPLIIGVFIQFPPFDKYAYMMSRTRSDVVVGGTFIAQLLILAIGLIFYKGVIGSSYQRAFLLVLFSLGVALYTFGFKVEFAYRFSLYLLPIAVLLLALYKDFIGRFLVLCHINLRSMPFVIIGLVGVGYFVSVYLLSARFDIFPYVFLWQGGVL